MAKASDNAFPSILITEGTEPAAPAAGKQRLYIDSTTHKLKRTDSSGTDVDLEGGAPLASPTFTGDPKAPTASPGDNDTSIATTAFVTAAVAAGGGFTNTLAVVAASGGLTTTTSETDITGATTTVTVASTSDVYHVTAFFDIDVTTASTGVIVVGALNVDGSTQTAQALFLGNVVSRGTVGQQWRITGLTAGSRVFKLRGSKTAGTGVMNINGTHTTLAVQRIS